jgi:hypothetical protein
LQVAQSATQKWSYEVNLWRVALVRTTNYWPPAVGPQDWGWLEENVVAVAVDEAVWQD